MTVQTDAAGELGAIPFGNIIGGPLVAAIEAQAQAAKSTVDFIQAVAFVPTDPEDFSVNRNNAPAAKQLQTVEFKYKSGDKDVTLIVPLLVIVPIPYIRIDDMTIQFKANISAETATKDTSNSSAQNEITSSTGSKVGWGIASFQTNFTAKYSAKKDSSSAANSKYAVEYTMDIYIHAVQDDMPAGMQTVLKLLNDSVQGEAPMTTTTTTRGS